MENIYYRNKLGELEKIVLPINNGGTGVTTEKELALKFHPVGSLYISTSLTSPAQLFGGSWVQIKDKVIRAGSTVGTGGSDTVSHSHTLNNGAANIVMYESGYMANARKYPLNTSFAISSRYHIDTVQAVTSSSTTGTSLSGTTDNTSVSNLPAYQNLYCWWRTA